MNRQTSRAAAGAPETRELTIRGVALGIALTVVFMSANLYLGLKTGMTFSSSIPAATISMAVLTLMGGAGMLENNIVQTQASAAGTLCNVILVIPGLVMAHAWSRFPLWQTMLLCLVGGLLGVAYSVPLRRALVLGTDLPFPEGVAAAEVLKSAHSSGGRSGGGLRDLGIGAAAAAALDLATAGLRMLPDHLASTFQHGRAIFQVGGDLSLALIGVGYLVRIGACLALLIGVVFAWGIAVPLLTSALPSQPHDAAGAAVTVWSDKVRLIGAGIIAVTGIWTVATLIKPIIECFRPVSQADRGERVRQDIPIGYVGGAVLGLGAASIGLFALFHADGTFGGSFGPIVLVTGAVTVALSFLMAGACGYMAGLLGSSSSPISGIGILATMVAALGLSLSPANSGMPRDFAVAFALFVASFVVTTSSIANDNLQDLKTGQILGATPWKQQAALAIGVTVGAMTAAPVLNVLYDAYGFVGALPRPGMDPANAMPAPQAALMTQVARGIVHHQLDWTMVLIGGGLGALLAAAEAFLRRRGISLPALTVGIGMYLPCDVVVTIACGGIIGWVSERSIALRVGRERADEAQQGGRRRGVLVASGFLVGESLVGVLVATSDTIVGRSNSLALASTHGPLATSVAAVIFLAVAAAFGVAVARAGRGDLPARRPA